MQNLTAEQIDEYARKGDTLPDGHTLSAYMLWHSLRSLYWEYKERIVTIDTARREKRRMFDQYTDQARWERIYYEDNRRMNEISRLEVRAMREGCPICKQMTEIFTGVRREVCEDRRVKP